MSNLIRKFDFLSNNPVSFTVKGHGYQYRSICGTVVTVFLFSYFLGQFFTEMIKLAQMENLIFNQIEKMDELRNEVNIEKAQLLPFIQIVDFNSQKTALDFDSLEFEKSY